MKYVLIAGVLIIIGGAYYSWGEKTLLVPKGGLPYDIIATTTILETTVVEESTEQRYHNEEWGITFSYPSDWVIKEPAFGSAVSLFNFSIEPTFEKKFPDPILVNITPKTWIENALEKMQMDGIIFSNTKIYGLDAIRFESSYEGMPQIDYLILVNDTYWINVAGKKDYEETLNQVLASLVITPVGIPAAN